MKWRPASTMGVAALALCAAYALWLVTRPSPPSAPLVDATPAPQVAGVPTVAIQPARIKVLAPAAKRKLYLPPSIQSDEAAHVAAASRVDAGIHPVTVSTILDERTGEITTYTREEPLPWIATVRRGEAGIAYGMKAGGMTGRVYINQGLLDVKALRLGATASFDQDGEWFAGVALAYRW